MALITSYMPDPPPKATRQTPALDDFNSSSRQVAAGPRHTGQSAKWQEAQERVLLYLKLLGIVSPASLDIARRVLELAAARGRTTRTSRLYLWRGRCACCTDCWPMSRRFCSRLRLPIIRRCIGAGARLTKGRHICRRNRGREYDFIAVPAISRGFMRTKRIA